MLEFDFFVRNLFTNVVIIDVNVLGARMNDGIPGQSYTFSAIHIYHRGPKLFEVEVV